jgi:hypothetical protein
MQLCVKSLWILIELWDFIYMRLLQCFEHSAGKRVSSKIAIISSRYGRNRLITASGLGTYGEYK